jgi:hypothetical protein
VANRRVIRFIVEVLDGGTCERRRSVTRNITAMN